MADSRSVALPNGIVMSVTVFTNGRVFDGVNPELAERSVAVEGDRIREVSDRPIRVSDARVIDLGGRVLMRMCMCSRSI
jgi:predicted amidohydrolase YtcJ